MAGFYTNSIVVCLLYLVLFAEGHIQKVPCQQSSDCNGVAGRMCISDFCQPSPCSSNDQCVKGQVCAKHQPSRECVYPIHLEADEGDDVTLSFPASAAEGSYEMIRWYKGMAMRSIVFYHRNLTGSTPRYYDEYCGDTCNTSKRLSLDTSTGELTIRDLSIRDEDYYYFRFYVPGEPEGGGKHQIMLEVSTLGGKIELFFGVVVAVVVVLGIVICALVLVKRYKKFRKRYDSVHSNRKPAHPEEDKKVEEH